MNLIIDIGNTQTKYALFQKGEMLEFCVSQILDISLIENWLLKHPRLDAAILSSVQGKPTDFLDFLDSKFEKLIFFDQNIPTPLVNLYESKETLGYDRLAACVGANSICPNTNLLVIDAGTAITFDFVSAANAYLGGTISPGLSMRFKALNSFTKKLPLLKQSDSFSLIGKNTEGAIISGVQNSILFEVDSYINKLNETHSNTNVFLTGGDSGFIYSKLKHNAIHRNNLLLVGLDAILDYNNV
ncbi:type III pantothenate kinase [Ancylomarina sp. 16SWW S1-10-2]|uniref:type III pantothenate kinase n=1 Tax=Ancylomarina sp. 16SWW S1-10-2 TaxID=2499681 RepID=UPI00189F25CF|nr:type III pantothenate kinase [Ancylomarina sp. 16SWW S1-10-2]